MTYISLLFGIIYFWFTIKYKVMTLPLLDIAVILTMFFDIKYILKGIY